MSIEGQGHFFTTSIYFPGFVCFVLCYAKISGERLQDHWSSGIKDWDDILADSSLLGTKHKSLVLSCSSSYVVQQRSHCKVCLHM